MRRLRVLVVTCVLLTALGAPFAAQEDELASPKLRIAWAEFKTSYDAGTVAVVDVRGTGGVRGWPYSWRAVSSARRG